MTQRRLTITLRPGEQRVITIPAEWAGQRVRVSGARKKVGTKTIGDKLMIRIVRPEAAAE